MNLNCPICKQAGLPDYRSEHTICPQCNSDLKPYLLLHKVSSLQHRSKINFSILSVIIFGFLVLVYLYYSNRNESSHMLAGIQKEYSILEDSLETYRDIIFSLTNNEIKKTEKQEVILTYMVRDGDYLSKIAQIFYNDWRMYEKIAEENNLSSPYMLHIDQTLIINLNSE